MLLSAVLTACSTPGSSADAHGDDSGSTESGSPTTESGSSTTDTTWGTGSPFLHGLDEPAAPDCDPFAQDCPAGEKCVPYSSWGQDWDAFKCVWVTGDQATGEPCTYAGIEEATDDCDELSGCWGVQDLEGETVGTCHAFCMGSADNPQCPPGSICKLSGLGVPAYCFPTCDPLAQDCGPGLGCYFSGSDFECMVSSQNIPAGEPCGFIHSCAPGLVCLTAEVFPACNGASCCGLLCNLDLGDAQCEATPGTACEPFFDNNTAPPGLEHVGICIVPL
jgi:hypothetical protein